MKVDFFWHNYKYLPYERNLAYRELTTLLGQEPVHTNWNEGLSIESSDGWESSAYRSTYFREVIAENSSRIIPLQTYLEASTNGKHSSTLPNMDLSPTVTRQSTRYSAHGIHEYKGKFNPQMVRVIGNILGLQPGQWLLDPFCGSGTSLLEAAHVGWNAVGIEINPLGVQISRAKVAAMKVSTDELNAYTEKLCKKLGEKFREINTDKAFTKSQAQMVGGENWQNRLPSFDYLSSWFKESVLVQLSVILDEIAQIPSQDIQLILQVILSDIVREVSLQDPTDLRIRRRKSPPENAPAVPIYIDAVRSKIKTILKARQYITEVSTKQVTLLGDSRYCTSLIEANSEVVEVKQFDAAITSPPYATALPYIDTQRLSLVLLGLIKSEEIRIMERIVTGSREITTQERLKIEQDIDTNTDKLPSECIFLCRKLKDALDINLDGFRRQNVPALIYKYFVDMALVFRQVSKLLRKDAPFALVVGTNQTRLGGQTTIIDTPYLLTLLAEQNGFSVQETLELDTYQRYDIHQVNSINSETLIILRRAEYADRGYSSIELGSVNRLRVGDLLNQSISDNTCQKFLFAVAYMRLSGLDRLGASIDALLNRGGRVSGAIGVDQEITSIEALMALSQVSSDSTIFYTISGFIYHPKLYLMSSEKQAIVVVGSPNLTCDGLFRNIELATAIYLDFEHSTDLKVYEQYETFISELLNTTHPNVQRIDENTLQILIKDGVIKSEARTREPGPPVRSPKEML